MPHNNKTHLAHYETSGGYFKAYCGAYVDKDHSVQRFGKDVTCKHCCNAWDKSRKFFK